MTDFKTTDREVDRVIRSWLHEDRHEDVSRVAGAVLDQVDTTPQRRSTWWPARRTPTMNKFLTIGLAAAAVVVALFVGVQLFGSPDEGTGVHSTPIATPTTDVTPRTTPSLSAQSGLPVGSSYTLHDERLLIAATIPGPGWAVDDGVLSPSGNSTPPDGAFVGAGWGGELFIPRDPCQWRSTMPDAQAATLDEIVAALGSQATRDASEPVDVTVDGRPGKTITLHTPSGPFSDCDEEKFCTLSLDGSQCYMWYQEPEMIDELWIVDLNGPFEVVVGSYWPETPPDELEELRAFLGSMTFGD